MKVAWIIGNMEYVKSQFCYLNHATFSIKVDQTVKTTLKNVRKRSTRKALNVNNTVNALAHKALTALFSHFMLHALSIRN